MSATSLPLPLAGLSQPHEPDPCPPPTPFLLVSFLFWSKGKRIWLPKRLGREQQGDPRLIP